MRRRDPRAGRPPQGPQGSGAAVRDSRGGGSRGGREDRRCDPLPLRLARAAHRAQPVAALLLARLGGARGRALRERARRPRVPPHGLDGLRLRARRRFRRLLPRAPLGRRRRMLLRPRRALRRVRPQRTVGRDVERGRRHLLGADLQEHPPAALLARMGRLRQRPGARLVGGLLRAHRPRAVLRRGRAPRLRFLRRPRPARRPAPLHVAAGPPRAPPAVDVRPVALHVVPHAIRREDRALVRRRHARPRHSALGLPLRLLLDAAVPTSRRPPRSSTRGSRRATSCTGGTATSGSGTSGSRASRSSTSRTPTRRGGTRTSSPRCSTWAWTA